MKRQNVLASAIVSVLLFGAPPATLALETQSYSHSYIEFIKSKIIEDTKNVALTLKAVKANPEALSLFETSNKEYQVAQDKLYASLALLKEAKVALSNATLLWRSSSNNLLLAEEYRNGFLRERFRIRLNAYNEARQSFKDNPGDLTLHYAKNKAYQDFRTTFATGKLARSLYLSQKDNPTLLQETIGATNVAMVLAQTNLDVNMAITISNNASFNVIAADIKNSWDNNPLLRAYIDAYSALKVDQALLDSVLKLKPTR